MPEALLPILGLIRRELVSSLRTSRYFYLVLIAVVLSTLSVMMLWPRANSLPMEMAGASSSIFVALTLVLAGGAALAVPALAGSSIVSEREEGTFELLAMTSAKPWHIIVAKLTNAAGHYLLLLVSLAPLVASAFFLVGLNIDSLWKSLLIVSSTAMLCATAGVFCSCVVRKPMAAVGLSYVAMLTIVGFPMLLLLVVAEVLGFRRIEPFLSDFGMYVMPMFAYVELVEGGPTGRHPVEICSALCIAISIMLIIIAHFMVRRNWGEAAEVSVPDGPRAQKKPRRIRHFSEFINPQFQREAWFEFPLRGWPGFLILGVPFGLSFSACLTFIAVSWANNEHATLEVFFGWLYLQAVLLPMLFIAITGNLFAKEAERANLDALRVSLLTAETVAAGKLMASFRVAYVMVAMAMIGMAPLIFVNPLWTGDGLRILAYGSIMLGTCMLTSWSVTAFCSVVGRRMATALVLSFMVTAMHLIGFSMILFAISESFFRHSFSSERWAGLFSPYFATAWVVYPQPTQIEYEGIFWIASLALSLFTVILFVALSFRSFRTTYSRD